MPSNECLVFFNSRTEQAEPLRQVPLRPRVQGQAAQMRTLLTSVLMMILMTSIHDQLNLVCLDRLETEQDLYLCSAFRFRVCLELI